MATKTISVDIEAYDRLKRVQQPNETFSQTIKRVIQPRPSLEDLLRKLEQSPIGASAARAIEDQIKHRRRPSKRAR